MNENSTEDKQVKSIFKASIIVGALLAVASIFVQNAAHTSGVLIGAFVGSANYYLLVRLVKSIMSDDPNKTALIVRFMLKYVFLIFVIAAVLLVSSISELGFLIGVSNIVIAVFLGAIGIISSSENVNKKE